MPGLARLIAPFAAALAVAAAPLPASAMSRADAPVNLVLTVHHGEDVIGPVDARVTLDCFPTGGTHPHAEAACGALADADGEFADLPRGRGICPHLVDPVTAEATGYWFGRRVRYLMTFHNRCEAGRATAGVFAF